MTCSEIEAALNDYVDGDLDDGARSSLESHLAGCPRCSKNLRMLQSLLERSARLPREVSPSVDLWPDVRNGLRLRGPRSSRPRKVPVAERFSRSGWRLAAAGILLVISTAAITYLIVRPPGIQSVDITTDVMEVPAGGVRVLSEFRQAEAAFTDAADHLGSLLDTRRGEISPETIAVVEHNLQIINRAIVDARRALEKDPGNIRLGHLLTAMHHQKVDLLRRATRLSDPV
jgi:hypothetical protein